MSAVLAIAPSLALIASVQAASPSTAELGPAPRLPAGVVPRVLPGPFAAPLAATATDAISVDPANRYQVSVLYRDVYVPQIALTLNTVNTAIPPAVCNAGSTPAASQAATLARINVFRTLASLPGNITDFGVPPYQADDQAAALIVAASGVPSHYPPNTYPCWTQAGYDDASRSNLTRAYSTDTLAVYAGTHAVQGYMDDAGSNNVTAGHRRWLLYPPQAQMTSADAIADWSDQNVPLYAASNMLWVTGAGSNYQFGTRAPTPQGTPWPPRG